MMQPLVSVIMPVYNAEKYLAQAIESILDQSFESFEFIIVDDGSTDNSLQIMRSYKDKRMAIISRPNKGVSASRNEAILASSGKYIAMQDADDISRIDRLEKQLNFLEFNSLIGLVGSNYNVIDEKGRILTTTNVLTHPDDLKLGLICFNQMGQGTVMARSEILKKHKYDEGLALAEDYDLWNRVAHEARVANLKAPLYKWRRHTESAWTSNLHELRKFAFQIRNREFKHYLDNKHGYKIFSLHPFSTRSIRAYLKKKSQIYRDIALMYCLAGSRSRSIALLLMTILISPLSERTYKQLFLTTFNKKELKNIEYEGI